MSLVERRLRLPKTGQKRPRRARGLRAGRCPCAGNCWMVCPMGAGVQGAAFARGTARSAPIRATSEPPGQAPVSHPQALSPTPAALAARTEYPSVPVSHSQALSPTLKPCLPPRRPGGPDGVPVGVCLLLSSPVSHPLLGKNAKNTAPRPASRARPPPPPPGIRTRPVSPRRVAFGR